MKLFRLLLVTVCCTFGAVATPSYATESPSPATDAPSFTDDDCANCERPTDPLRPPRKP